MADKRHDFAGMEIDRHPVDRVNAAEGERNVTHLDERRGCGVRHAFLRR